MTDPIEQYRDRDARRKALELAVAFWAIPEVIVPPGRTVTDTAEDFCRFLVGETT
jgi:hypothetical protein